MARSMRKTVLSIAVGTGLLVGTAGTAAAQTNPTACASFVNEMQQTWSIEGYSSLQSAVNIVGADWFKQTCQGTQAMAIAMGTYDVANDPMRGQPAQVTNAVEQNPAFDGSFGSGQIEDDEANGTVITGNDSQGQEEDEER